MSTEPNQNPEPSNEAVRPLEAEAIGLVYHELRKRAASALRSLPPGQTIQPTDLVHEAYLKVEGSGGRWTSEAHFLAVASLAIRQVVVDRVRAKRTTRRGGGQKPISLDWDLPIPSPPVSDDIVLAIDGALEELRKKDARAADVVVFRFFLGMSIEQCAAALKVTDRTVRRDWLFARTWLGASLAVDAGLED